MKEKLVSFELAKLANKMGFLDKCETHNGKHYYNYKGELDGDVSEEIRFDIINNMELCNPYKSFAAPTLSLLQRWLLKEKNIFVEILYDYEHDSTSFHFDIIDINKHESIMKEDWSADYTEYDEALEHGLIYVFNLLEREMNL